MGIAPLLLPRVAAVPASRRDEDKRTDTDVTQARSATATHLSTVQGPDVSPPEQRRRVLSALGLAVGFVVLTWLAQGLSPATGLDPGWMLGLNLANQMGLEHGTEIMFTYGPLGWVARPQAIDAITVWGYMLYTSAILGVFAFTLLYTLAARYRWWIAAVATYALMAATPNYFLSELLMITSFALAMLVLQRTITGRMALWMPVMIGAVGGLQMTVKFATGLVTFGIAALLAVFGSTSLRQGLLGTAGAIGAGIVALLAGWLITGQSIGTLDDYLALSVQLSTEYVEMAKDSIERAWEYVVAVGLVIVVAIAVAWAGPSRTHTLATWGWLALLGVMTWHMFRYGFVRHGNHSLAFFWFIALCALVIQWRPRARYVSLGILSTAMLFMAVIINQPVTQLLDPTRSVQLFFSDARMALSVDARTQAMVAAAEDARTEYAAPDDVLAALEEGSTHIDSYQTTFAWAYDLDWQPAPVFQTYAAYSEGLDQRNADRLVDPDGPSHVLRRAESAIDQRFRLFETPRYTYEILCRFSHAIVADTWQVVERNPESRCGGPVSLGVVEITSGDRVSVPKPSTPDALVFAKIDVERTLAYSLLRRFFKPPPTSIVLNDRPFRIVANHLPGPLLLSIPDWNELPMRVLSVDGSDVEQLGVEGDGIRSVRIEFFEVPLNRANG